MAKLRLFSDNCGVFACNTVILFEIQNCYLLSIPDIVRKNLVGTMDDNGMCTTVPATCLSLLTSVFLHFSRVCIVTEFRGTCLELSFSTVSTTTDLGTKCWQCTENIATKSWSMIDESSSELTPASERMLTEVSTAQKNFPCVGACSLREFLSCQQ